MQTKFEIGEVIKHVNDPLADAGKIVNIVIHQTHVVYTIALKDWDQAKREVVDAVKHIAEDEAEKVEELTSQSDPLNIPQTQAATPPTQSVTIEEKQGAENG